MISFFQNSQTLSQSILTMISKSYQAAKKEDRHKIIFRNCPAISDSDFFFLCIRRVIGKYDSGRDFLQDLNEDLQENYSRSNFFDSLRSTRRTQSMIQIFQHSFDLFEKQAQISCIDYLSEFPELNDYSVFSGDGHFISHSTHTIPTKGAKTYAAGSIYIQNIRTGNMLPLSPCSDGSYKTHEMPILKDVVSKLTGDHFGKSKTLWILDRGYIKNNWWEKQTKKGHYFISQCKNNFHPFLCGNIPFNQDDPINRGVKRYYLAGFTSCSSCYTLVDYQDPETGEEYSFITSLQPDFKPGLISWLYFKRWNIEKSFDTFKNDLKETKAWAHGMNACFSFF